MVPPPEAVPVARRTSFSDSWDSSAHTWAVEGEKSPSSHSSQPSPPLLLCPAARAQATVRARKTDRAAAPWKIRQGQGEWSRSRALPSASGSPMAATAASSASTRSIPAACRASLWSSRWSSSSRATWGRSHLQRMCWVTRRQ